jgi:SAM-dependent methyltransferase
MQFLSSIKSSPAEKSSRLTEEVDRQQILAVCEHFSFHPLASFDCLDIGEHAEGQAYFERYFSRYVFSRALEGDFSDESFDLIICDSIYHRVQNFTALADEIYRLLKTGGFCYFSGNGFPSPRDNEENLTENFHLTRRNLRKKLSNFWIHDYTPLIRENPQAFHGREKSSSAKRGFLGYLKDIFLSTYYGEFVWVLTKKK